MKESWRIHQEEEDGTSGHIYFIRNDVSLWLQNIPPAILKMLRCSDSMREQYLISVQGILDVPQ